MTPVLQTSLKGTLRLFWTYSLYPPELDKSINTFFILVHAVTLFDALTTSLAQRLYVNGCN